MELVSAETVVSWRVRLHKTEIPDEADWGVRPKSVRFFEASDLLGLRSMHHYGSQYCKAAVG